MASRRTAVLGVCHLTPAGPTSGVEVTNVSAHGFWLLFSDREIFVPFAKFPWFRDAALGELTEVQLALAGHLRWPRLDVDLTVDSLEDPDRYPLVSRLSPARRPFQLRRQELLVSREEQLAAVDDPPRTNRRRTRTAARCPPRARARDRLADGRPLGAAKLMDLALREAVAVRHDRSSVARRAVDSFYRYFSPRSMNATNPRVTATWPSQKPNAHLICSAR